jgi:hypothetical protein
MSDLPPLPEYAQEFRPRWPDDLGGFNGAQMREYARAALAAAQPAQVEPVAQTEQALPRSENWLLATWYDLCGQRISERVRILSFARAIMDAAQPAQAEPVARNREADRLRFPDPAFNRWLDEGISDAGHTVWDQIGSVADAWHGWENRAFYTAPPQPLTLTSGQIARCMVMVSDPLLWGRMGDQCGVIAEEFARAVLAAAQEKQT